MALRRYERVQRRARGVHCCPSHGPCGVHLRRGRGNDAEDAHFPASVRVRQLAGAEAFPLAGMPLLFEVCKSRLNCVLVCAGRCCSVRVFTPIPAANSDCPS